MSLYVPINDLFCPLVTKVKYNNPASIMIKQYYERLMLPTMKKLTDKNLQ